MRRLLLYIWQYLILIVPLEYKCFVFRGSGGIPKIFTMGFCSTMRGMNFTLSLLFCWLWLHSKDIYDVYLGFCSTMFLAHFCY
jgi:hypothetical protein